MTAGNGGVESITARPSIRWAADGGLRAALCFFDFWLTAGSRNFPSEQPFRSICDTSPLLLAIRPFQRCPRLWTQTCRAAMTPAKRSKAESATRSSIPMGAASCSNRIRRDRGSRRRRSASESLPPNFPFIDRVFADGGYAGNEGRLPHSGSMRASAAILFHFSVSVAWNSSSSSGVLVSGSTPAASNRSDTSLSASASRKAALSFSMIGFGVFAGA